MTLKHFNVTVRRFNPNGNGESEEFVLPVDSPDAEHAVSSTLANAISWTTKTSGTSLEPIAFQAVAITERES